MGAKKKFLFAVVLLAVLAVGFMFVLREASKVFADDEAYSVIQTSDGGYALAGETYYLHSDFWLVKTDASGNMQWNKGYGAAGGVSAAMSVVQASDGGYALVGNLFPDAFWFIKTDAAGNTQWNKTYGGWLSVDGDVIQTSDKGFAFLAAATNQNALFVKTDALGNMQWNKTYGGASREIVRSLIQTSDGGYALAGDTDSSGNGDFWLVKTDSAGKTEWSKAYGRQVYGFSIPWFAYTGESTRSVSALSFGWAKRISGWLRETQN